MRREKPDPTRKYEEAENLAIRKGEGPVSRPLVVL